MRIIGGDRNIVEQLSGRFSIQGLEAKSLVLDYVAPSKLRRKKDSLILLRFEGPTSSPLSHSRSYTRMFESIFDVGSKANFPWPLKDISFTDEQQRRISRGVMILGNKLSFSKSEFYSLRRQIALNLPSLDLFGTDWQMGFSQKIVTFCKALALSVLGRNFKVSAAQYWFRSFPSSAIPIDSKSLVYSRYKVALVVENDASRVTEKLFDALAAGCIVIYVGPSLANYDSVFLERVIECRPDLEAIRSALNFALLLPWSSPSPQQVERLKIHIEQSTSRMIYELDNEINNANRIQNLDR